MHVSRIILFPLKGSEAPDAAQMSKMSANRSIQLKQVEKMPGNVSGNDTFEMSDSSRQKEPCAAVPLRSHPPACWMI